ncbi:hypothetical protein OG874_44270 [Nocardia sp. NBC_00565]|uniref:Rv1733c family protein n=1 Tax=Nocardia sp. NBC_00565 TaxID=2975993 RepID=UPI002E8158CE|nr:hypothetical protein [Nocardia sp. NBC_00565]WUC03581.1 hypothetical protein OG874_44270 [Nocardia sp. NBC_00565]
MSTLPVRMWRVQPWNPSPLMRVSDRVQGLVRILVVLVLLLGVPAAAASGTAAYSSAAEQIRAENATKTAVSATVIGTPVRMQVADRNGTTAEHYQAAVTWDRDGKSGRATIVVPDTAQAGAAVPLWLGPDGQPTAAPQRSSAAAIRGIGVGATVLIEIWVGAAAVLWSTGWVLDHRRHARWDREWRQISHPTGHGSQ